MENLSASKAKSFLGKVALIAWYIWKARNEFIFRSLKVDPVATMFRISDAWSEVSNIVETPIVHMDNPSSQEEVSTWRAPDKNHFKANCDVAIPKNGGEGKLAVLIRNWKGKILDGITRPIRALSSLHGELQAIRAACLMITRMGMKDVTVEADNKQAILLSVSETVPPWEVSAEVLDIRQLAANGSIKFSWIRREANKAAHETAALAKKNYLPCNWITLPPLSLFSILCNDGIISVL